MKDLGPAKKIPGMKILRDRQASKLNLSQKGYIEKVLCRFNMQIAKPVMGSLMYDMACSRPDLTYAVIAVSRYMANLDGVIGYVDADFARDLDRRRSLTGYVFTIRGYEISWKATSQTIVTLSTTEAENMVITEACKEAIWLKGLFSELNEDLQINTIFCDSQSSIFLTKDQML
ncbi:hypothetical protein CXB51_015086 [Gossypium anomalum]|uniref:Reverse transcriptase Ty1/copia-type domain-containing protein n=1 Tax=Gossypium anomalum TaxID=47600 RepID=A0A8J5YKV5_9ROSI|nr:hypothetical protein CXB51_015086 [Gossypium anomalum]